MSLHSAGGMVIAGWRSHLLSTDWCHHRKSGQDIDRSRVGLQYQDAVAEVGLVASVAGCCDPLCDSLCDRVVAGIARDDGRRISGDGEHGSSSNNNNHNSTLRHLLRSDLKLPHRLTSEGAASRMEKEAAPVRAATAPPSDECGCRRIPRADEEAMVDVDVETTREVGRRRVQGGDGAMEDRVAVQYSCCASVIIDGKRVV